MKNEFKAGIVATVLIMGMAVIFSGFLNRSQNVLPLFLAPALLFAGYAVGSSGFKVWAAMTIAITVLLALLYAIP